MKTDCKAARLLFHKDTDGFFAALIVLNHLVDGGMDPENITFGMLQYGEWGDSFMRLFQNRPGQALFILDFSDIPVNVITGNDVFWSDHHKANNRSELVFSKVRAIGEISAVDFGSEAAHIIDSMKAKKLCGIEDVTKIDSASYYDIFNTLGLFAGNGEYDIIRLNSYITELIKANPAVVYRLLKISKPDVKDVQKNLIKARSWHNMQVLGIKEFSNEEVNMGMVNSIRTNFPGELAVCVENPGHKKVDNINIEKIAIEFSKYVTSQLFKDRPKWNRIVQIARNLPKRIRNQLKKELARIRPIIREMKKYSHNKYNYRNRVDPLLIGIRDIILERYKKPGVVRCHRLRDMYFWQNKNAMDMILATVGEEEIEVAENLLLKFKKDLDIFVAKYGNTKRKTQPLEIAEKRYELKDRVKRAEKLVDILKKANKTFSESGNVIIQDATALSKYPTRYLSFMLSGENGRFPFGIKRFPIMIQISANPEIEDRSGIDLVTDMKEVLNKIQDKYEEKNNRWAWKIIWDKMGGHDCISTMNISVLNTAFMRKLIKEEMKVDDLKTIIKSIFSIPMRERLYWELDKYGITSKMITIIKDRLRILDKRIKNIDLKRRYKFGTIKEFINIFESFREKAREKTRIIREEIISNLIIICNEKYKNISVKESKNETYRIKPVIEEK